VEEGSRTCSNQIATTTQNIPAAHVCTLSVRSNVSTPADADADADEFVEETEVDGGRDKGGSVEFFVGVAQDGLAKGDGTGFFFLDVCRCVLGVNFAFITGDFGSRCTLLLLLELLLLLLLLLLILLCFVTLLYN